NSFSVRDRRVLFCADAANAVGEIYFQRRLGNADRGGCRGGLVSADVSDERLGIHRRIFHPTSFPALHVEQIPSSAAVLFLLFRASADDFAVASVLCRKALADVP